MARIHDTHPKTETDAFAQTELNASRPSSGRPAFFVNSAGVATHGNVIRGDGFTMRSGDAWPRYRPQRRDMH